MLLWQVPEQCPAHGLAGRQAGWRGSFCHIRDIPHSRFDGQTTNAERERARAGGGKVQERPAGRAQLFKTSSQVSTMDGNQDETWLTGSGPMAGYCTHYDASWSVSTQIEAEGTESTRGTEARKGFVELLVALKSEKVIEILNRNIE